MTHFDAETKFKNEKFDLIKGNTFSKYRLRGHGKPVYVMDLVF